MQKQLIKLSINILSFYLASIICRSIQLDSLATILYAGSILWLINLLIRPLLLLLSLPVNLITLGLFSLIINTWMVLLTDTLVAGLRIPSFWIGFTIALLIAAFNMIFKDKRQISC